MQQEINIPAKIERPPMLTALCILTFLWSGGATFLFLISIVLHNWITKIISTHFTEFQSLNSKYFLIAFLVLFILFGSSLLGAWLMFRLKKYGYYFYVIPNSFMIFMSFFINFNFMNVLYLLVSIIFVILYTIQFKHLKVLYKTENN